jgi:hypothetical protein
MPHLSAEPLRHMSRDLDNGYLETRKDRPSPPPILIVDCFTTTAWSDSLGRLMYTPGGPDRDALLAPEIVAVPSRQGEQAWCLGLIMKPGDIKAISFCILDPLHTPSLHHKLETSLRRLVLKMHPAATPADERRVRGLMPSYPGVSRLCFIYFFSLK